MTMCNPIEGNPPMNTFRPFYLAAVALGVALVTLAAQAGWEDDIARSVGAKRDPSFGGYEGHRLAEAQASRAGAGAMHRDHDAALDRNSSGSYRNERDLNRTRQNRVPGHRSRGDQNRALQDTCCKPGPWEG
jgi:hypothetical protein